MLTIIIIIIVLLLLFGGGYWGYSSRSYGGPGILWALAIILLILWLLGVIRF
jgi:hypothetical protein